MNVLDMFNRRQLFNPRVSQFQIPSFDSSPTVGSNANPMRGQNFTSPTPEVKEESIPALERFLSMLQSRPEAEPVSKWRRLGAGLVGGLAGFGSRNPSVGIQAAGDIIRSPHDQKMQTWMSDLQGLHTAAGLENSNRKLDMDQFFKMLEESRLGKTAEANANLADTRAATLRGETAPAKSELETNELERQRIKAQIDEINGITPNSAAEVAERNARIDAIRNDIENSNLTDSERIRLEQGLITNRAITVEDMQQQGSKLGGGTLEENRILQSELNRIWTDPELRQRYDNFITAPTRSNANYNLKPPTKSFWESPEEFETRKRTYDELRDRLKMKPRSTTVAPDDETAIEYLKENYPESKLTPEDIEWAKEQMGGN